MSNYDDLQEVGKGCKQNVPPGTSKQSCLQYGQPGVAQNVTYSGRDLEFLPFLCFFLDDSGRLLASMSTS